LPEGFKAWYDLSPRYAGFDTNAEMQQHYLSAHAKSLICRALPNRQEPKERWHQAAATLSCDQAMPTWLTRGLGWTVVYFHGQPPASYKYCGGRLYRQHINFIATFRADNGASHYSAGYATIEKGILSPRVDRSVWMHIFLFENGATPTKPMSAALRAQMGLSSVDDALLHSHKNFGKRLQSLSLGLVTSWVLWGVAARLDQRNRSAFSLL